MKHYYANILYDGKTDDFHYVGTQKYKELTVHLYSGEKYGYTIAKTTIDCIIEGELYNKTKSL